MKEYKHFFPFINPLAKLAEEASDVILKIYKKGNYDLKYKSDSSPVTIADVAANEIICNGLELLPEKFPYISEENMEVSYDIRKSYEFFWLIDPLDGTKEFMKGSGDFTINIALIHNHVPVLGLVVSPVYNTFYYAVKGCGSFLEKDNMTCRMQCSTFSMNQKNLKIPCSQSHINKDTKDFIQQFDDAVMIARGSALKFMMVANAEADLYPRLAPTMEWDTAAPQIIVEEAGGSVIEYQSNQPLRYNKESLVNPGLICYSILENV